MGATDSKAGVNHVTSDPDPGVPTLQDAVKQYLDDLVSKQKPEKWKNDYEASWKSQEIMFRLMMLLHQCPNHNTPTFGCVALLICQPFISISLHGLLLKRKGGWLRI